MALRDQPYLPLYVQDFLTDEKLMECSALATGIYIRIMCIMHKSDEYGVILLKQKDKQSDCQRKNFALKLTKYMPFDFSIISTGLNELIDEEVLNVEGDKLIQKRMVRDNEISIIRANAGSRGGLAKSKSIAKGIAKSEANTEDENENINKDINEDKNIIKREIKFKSEVFEFMTKYSEVMLDKFVNYWTEKNKSGTKMRYELEKTFEITKRLATWASNDKNFNKNVQEKQNSVFDKYLIKDGK
jgi:hypothetical protein